MAPGSPPGSASRKNTLQASVPPMWSVGDSPGKAPPERRPSMIFELPDKVRNFSRSVRHAAKDEMTYEAVRFAHTTTAHGIPMVSAGVVWGQADGLLVVHVPVFAPDPLFSPPTNPALVLRH